VIRISWPLTRPWFVRLCVRQIHADVCCASNVSRPSTFQC
jgi:hypothetical protein